jgi:ribonuclease BN (tRNA processing enzyme)
VRFTVLGKSPAWADAGGASSSYLVEEGSYRLLIDHGNGAFAKLRERIPYTEIDEVLISHIHADHVLDLVPFAYALTLGASATGDEPQSKPRLWLPAGGHEQLRRMVSVWGSAGLIDAAFDVRTYETAGSLELGPLTAALHPVPHFTLTHAIALTSPAGGRLVYGADCRAGDEIVEAAHGAEVLLAESTLPEPEPDSVPVADRGHMCAAEAGEVGRRAGVGRLVLTHFSDQLDGDAMLAQASAAFGGPVELAGEGSSWEL